MGVARRGSGRLPTTSAAHFAPVDSRTAPPPRLSEVERAECGRKAKIGMFVGRVLITLVFIQSARSKIQRNPRRSRAAQRTVFLTRSCRRRWVRSDRCVNADRRFGARTAESAKISTPAAIPSAVLLSL